MTRFYGSLKYGFSPFRHGCILARIPQLLFIKEKFDCSSFKCQRRIYQNNYSPEARDCLLS